MAQNFTIIFHLSKNIFTTRRIPSQILQGPDTRVVVKYALQRPYMYVRLAIE